MSPTWDERVERAGRALHTVFLAVAWVAALFFAALLLVFLSGTVVTYLQHR